MMDSLKQRIVKLMNMSDGAKRLGNQVEAEAFATKAQALLTQHKLTMSDLDIAKQETDDPIRGEVFDPYYVRGVKPRRTRMFWQEILATAVAKNYFCEILVMPDSNKFIFFGRDSDREVAMYIYHTLISAAERLVKMEYRRAKRAHDGLPGEWSKGFHSSFLMGFAVGINERLIENKRQLMRGAASTALVRIEKDQEAVKAEQAKFAVSDDAVPRSPKELNRISFLRGRQQANEVPINENVIKSKRPNQQLN